MTGLKTTNDMTREEVRAAVRAIPPEQDYVWDGKDEDERPATDEELRAGLEAARILANPEACAEHDAQAPEFESIKRGLLEAIEHAEGRAPETAIHRPRPPVAQVTSNVKPESKPDQ